MQPNTLFSELQLISSYPFSDNHDKTLIDVGAHQGCFSLEFALKGWQVVAFEPEKRNHQLFANRLKDFDKVACRLEAVSDVSGEHIPFYTSDKHYGIHSLMPFHESHELAYEVKTIRLDDALLQLNTSTVTLLKVDIEGADFLALRGFDFERYRPELVMIEFMDSRSQPNFGYTHHDAVSYMRDKGYIAFVSEWAPIQEYGREGVETPPHLWLQCSPYPLDHEPSWGNLIFVPEQDRKKFELTLARYLTELKRSQTMGQIKALVKKVPGVENIYRRLIAK